MSRNEGTNRRAFLQGIVSASACGAIADTTPLANTPVGRIGCSPAFGYVGSLRPEGLDCIEVFRVNGHRWTRVQEAPSRAPAALVLHPGRRFLYAASRIALHEGLPRGTVEVFSIDEKSGELTLLQQRPLSLSGTEPRSLAITPDGRHLVVALYGGGAYNVLPVLPDGRLGGVKGIFKELGCGQHAEHQATAHPHTLLPNPAGRFVLTSDFGCDHLSVFTLTGDGGFQRTSKVPVPPGAGPGSMVWHPSGSLLYVMHQLKPAVSCHRYRQAEGIIEDHFQMVKLPGFSEGGAFEGGALTTDSVGKYLYASSPLGITVLAISPVSGCLSISHQGGNADVLQFSPSDQALYGVHQTGGSVFRMSINSATGRWNTVAQAASISSPISLALLFC